MTPFLELEHVSVWYDDYQVLDDVTLQVEENECVGLFGPNGHGKTTILRTISRLLHPKRGNIACCGRSFSKASPKEVVEAGIVHVPQGHQLFYRMSVLENLNLGAYTKAAWKARKQNLSEVFSLFPQLEERKHQRCSTLSGGERQMVAIGRGLMGHAKLLMLDEPSLGLAPKLKERVMEAVAAIKGYGQSLLLVEQDVQWVRMLTERMYLIEQGRVAMQGHSEEIMRRDQIRDIYFGRE